MYDIPCKCRKHGYTGETDRKWESREKEHQDKVKLTKRDIEEGKQESASRRMNEGDWGLARHSTTCTHEIDWENARIVGREQRWTQRKYLEGKETLRKKNEGRIPLNAYNKLEQWQPTLYAYFKDNVTSDRWNVTSNREQYIEKRRFITHCNIFHITFGV